MVVPVFKLLDRQQMILLSCPNCIFNHSPSLALPRNTGEGTPSPISWGRVGERVLLP